MQYSKYSSLETAKNITIWIVPCGQNKKVSQSWLQCNGQGPLSQKVKIIGGVTNTVKLRVEARVTI